MKLGVAIPTYDLESGRPLPLREVAEYARRAEALGFASAWVMDHHWLERDGARIGAHDPMVTMGYVAAVTSTITLGALVLANGYRPINQLSRESAALADALPGRFILGLGCGTREVEHTAFGLPFDHRVSRLESTLRALPDLLAGRRVTWQDEFVHLSDASTLVTQPAPPIWIAAFGPRMLGLTATYASGWNTAWHGPDTSIFRSQLETFRAAVVAAGRKPSDVEVSVGFLVLPGDRAGSGMAGDRADRMLVGAPERIAETLAAYAAAGATHGILNFSPSPFGRLDASLLDWAPKILQRVV